MLVMDSSGLASRYLVSRSRHLPDGGTGLNVRASVLVANGLALSTPTATEPLRHGRRKSTFSRHPYNLSSPTTFPKTCKSPAAERVWRNSAFVEGGCANWG